MEKGKKMSDTKFPFISALEKTIQKYIEDNNFVEVVRCKDCKWGTPHPEGDEYTKCFKLCTTFFSGHYCAWGERKEDG
jgi:hypothetical protein